MDECNSNAANAVFHDLNSAMNMNKMNPPEIREAGFSLRSRMIGFPGIADRKHHDRQVQWCEPNDFEVRTKGARSKAIQNLDEYLDEDGTAGWPVTSRGFTGEITMDFNGSVADYDFNELAVRLEDYNFEIAA